MTKQFNELGLPGQALRAIERLGYDMPTPVQEQAIPAILAGRDVIAAAKTGTGKTAAFCLPTISTLPFKREDRGPMMLILTPTRELAMQIEEVARVIAKQAGKRVVCLLGGVSYGPQRKALARGCDVLVATPGRLIDLLNQEALTLEHAGVLVLDEADRMLDMGFLPDVKRIVGRCPKSSERQTLLFSATIDKNIEKNLLHLLDNPQYVEIAHKGETADLVAEYQVEVEHRLKPDLLLAVLEHYGSERVIVFARTKYRVDTCVRKLRKAGYKVAAIHGGRSQAQRKTALQDFAKGTIDILVATDILARGIDISEVPYIVNFDLPHLPEDYVHRIGRTGRAGEEGLAISFVTPENKQEIRDITKLIGHEIPIIAVPGFDSEKSQQAIADKATRRAARKDPEIDAVMQEMKKARKKELKAEEPQVPGMLKPKKPKKKPKNAKSAQPSTKKKTSSGKKQPSGAKSYSAENGNRNGHKQGKKGNRQGERGKNGERRSQPKGHRRHQQSSHRKSQGHAGRNGKSHSANGSRDRRHHR